MMPFGLPAGRPSSKRTVARQCQFSPCIPHSASHLYVTPPSRFVVYVPVSIGASVGRTLLHGHRDKAPSAACSTGPHCECLSADFAINWEARARREYVGGAGLAERGRDEHDYDRAAISDF